MFLLKDALVLIFLAFRQVSSQCVYQQNVQDYSQYYVYSPNYPDYYSGPLSCNWSASATSPGSQIVLNCYAFDIPRSNNCNQDRLSISLTGDNRLLGAEYYCGYGTFELRSQNDKMFISLSAPSTSTGGRFLCNITAIPTSVPTPTPTPSNNCNCGWRKQTRIVGGTNTGVNEYPSMSGLVDLVERQLFCGASIISLRYSLTAAHCLLNKVVTETVLLVGDYDISTGTDTDASRLYAISQFIGHSGYNSITQVNDIALVKVDQDIMFSLEVGPVCLPWHITDKFEGIYVRALGWGTTSFAGPKSDILQQVDLQVISNGQCQTELRENVTDGQLCTYTKGKDSCQSDSGGPLLALNTDISKLFLVGIISYGVACATEQPAVNTRVTSYLDWIVEHTTDAQYCVVT